MEAQKFVLGDLQRGPSRRVCEKIRFRDLCSRPLARKPVRVGARVGIGRIGPDSLKVEFGI